MNAMQKSLKKTGLFVIFLAAIVLSGCDQSRVTNSNIAALKNVSEDADGLLVKFDATLASDYELRTIELDTLGLKELSPVGDLAPDWFRVVLKDDSVNLNQAYGAAQNVASIVAVEPNYFLYSHNVEPNDPEYVNQYVLHNEGQTGGMADVDIDAPEAWTVQPGAPVVVAIIDTGIDYLHEDLAANIWINKNEIADNGIDDDTNGYVDDVNGWNFISSTNVPGDDNGHGTHVAGIIGADANNEIGIVGVNPNVRLMPVKVFNAQGIATVSGVVQALQYAVDNGASFSNLSWGTSNFSQALYDAIKNAAKKNHLVVASVGNDGLNLDESEVYPASFDLNNIISVAAANERAQLASFSNFSVSGKAHIAAPGVAILSTSMRDAQQDGYPVGYGVESGTSSAAAVVSGVVSLMYSQDKDLIPWDIKQALFNSTDINSAFAEKIASGGLINAYGAVSQIANTGWVELLDEQEEATTEEGGLTSGTTTVEISKSELAMAISDVIELSVQGGVSPYTFEVSDVSIASVDNNGFLKALANGETQVIAIDANGVESSVTAVTVTNLSLTPNDIGPMLIGDNIEFHISGGLGPYKWGVVGDSYAVDLVVDETDSSYAAVSAKQPGRFELHIIDDNDNSVLLYASKSFDVYSNGVSINAPSTTSMLVSGELQLSATSTIGGLNWESSNPGVATVSSNGMVTAVAKGTTTIKVTDDFSQVDSIVITVNELPISIDIPVTDTIWVGVIKNTVQLSAQGGVAPYTWSTTSSDVSVDPDTGVVTAGSFTPVDILDASRVAKITVTDANGNTTFTNINVNKTYIGTSQVAMDLGSSVKLDVLAADGPGLMWNTNGSGSASFNPTTHYLTAEGVGTVVVTITDENGNTAWTKQISINALPLVVMEPATRDLWLGNASANSMTLIARDGTAPYEWTTESSLVSVDLNSGLVTAIDGGQTGQALVRVTDADGNTNAITLNVNKFEISASTLQIEAYDQLQLSTNGVGSASWSVSSQNFATVNQAGLLTTTGSGQVTISATDEIGNNTSVLVNIAPLQPLTIGTVNISTLWLGGTETVQLSANGGKAPYTWTVSTSSEGIISVGQNGLVIAESTGTGTVIIKDALNNIDTIQISVGVVSLAVSQSEIEEGDVVQLSAIGSGQLSFNVSGSGDATINSSTLELTATQPGNITVEMTDENGNTAQVNITINAVPNLAIDSVALAEIWIGNGNTINLSATGGKGDYTWSVQSGSSVASVNSNGRVTALSVGTATIKVSDAFGRTDTTDIIVNQTAISGASTVTLDVGQTHQFEGIGFGDLNWSVDSALATIDSSGFLTAVTAGTVIVSMLDENGNSAIDVTVTINSGSRH